MENVKHEWRKKEKDIYLPKAKPVIVDIPEFKYIALDGAGNPNSEAFQEYVEALYAIAYGIKMSYKKGIEVEGYFQYTVYPLEGVWDITDEAKKGSGNGWSKDDLVFKLMIRQPDFVTDEFFEKIKESVKVKKSNKKIDEVRLIRMTEGMCCQILHKGSYNDEPESFKMMEDYCTEQGYKRSLKTHREIYLSDPRKTADDKLKTVLRFKIN